MRVKDVMTPDPTTIAPTDSLFEAIQKMAKVGRRLPVVDEGRLVGIITDRDLRLAMNSPHMLRERWEDEHLLRFTPVESYMTHDPVTISAEAPLREAAEMLLETRFGGLPVVDDAGQLVGIITVTDLVRTLAQLLMTSPE